MTCNAERCDNTCSTNAYDGRSSRARPARARPESGFRLIRWWSPMRIRRAAVGWPALLVSLCCTSASAQTTTPTPPVPGTPPPIQGSTTIVPAATPSDTLTQLLLAKAVPAQVVLILQAVTPDDVHESEGQGSVGAGADRQPPVGTGRRLRAVRINRDNLRPALAGLVHHRPQMHVRDAGVRAPVDDVARVNHGVGNSRPGATRGAGRIAERLSGAETVGMLASNPSGKRPR